MGTMTTAHYVSKYGRVMVNCHTPVRSTSFKVTLVFGVSFEVERLPPSIGNSKATSFGNLFQNEE